MSDKHPGLTDTLRAQGGAPDHLPGFAAAIASGLDQADREMGRRVGGSVWRRWREAAARWRRLRLALAAAVALFVVAVVMLGAPSGVSLIEGSFDGSRVQGPVFPGPESAAAEPVEEVVRIAQRALRSVRLVSGDFSAWRGNPGDEPRFGSAIHVTLAADGSKRVTADLEHRAYEVTYDAATGVSRVWSASFGSGTSVRIKTEQRVGIAPGEPDGGRSLADFSLPVTNGAGWQLFGAVARIARAGTGGPAATGVFDGRPVWIVTCPVMLREPGERSAEATPAAGGSDAAERWLSVSVDRRSGLPVRVQSWVHGELTAELRLQNVEVDGPVADGAFTPGPPRAARVTSGDDGRLALSIDLGRSSTSTSLPFDPEKVSPEDVLVAIADDPAIEEDLGFRRVSIDQVPAATGRAVLVPTWMPDGFRLQCVAVGNEPGSPRGPSALADQVSADAGVVVLRYGFGFEAITVTTRRLGARRAPGQSAPGADPFIGSSWPGWTDSRTAVSLTGGALAGGQCRVVVAPLTIPHLWAVEGGTLLTVAGDASPEQLLAIANSIEPRGSPPDPHLPAYGPTAE